jgi:Derlin-2/3
MDGGAGVDLVAIYLEIPPVARFYLTASFLTTLLCSLDIISPFLLYYHYTLIVYEGQYWRLLTTFLYFGSFSLDFVFHMYFLVRYARLLEENDYRGRTASFVLMLLFGSVLMTLVAPFVTVHFLGSSLTFMMVYVWGRRNEDVTMSFLGK